MASSSSSSGGGDRKYDVFLSFRGEDTRKTFVGHLYGALQQSIINAYIDSEDLDKGKRISDLLIAIEDSKISIVVLSQDYASSKWCLRELAKIMECMDKKQQIVVPIFYDVDPSDVRKINGTFAQAFAKHEANSQLAKEELESWRLALTRVADLSGWDSRKYEDDRELIKNVVGDTLSKWIHTSSNKANRGLVGMDSHITEMNVKLCLEVNDVRVVGIWGMGGLGKTTIAKAVYGEIACEFEHSCFVHNVKEKREAEVQEELLLRLLKEKVQGIDLQRGRDMIMERLGTRKVLVVLDDVENFSQIKELLGEPHAFGKGSRIIVTTRDKQSPKEVDETYHPECFNQKKSRELLVKHAFGTDPPSEEYIDLLNQVIEYAQGLPLALQVLGASLYDKQIHHWKDLLAKIKKIPDRKIMDVLRISFEGLEFLEQQIFLDIACLFRGWSQDSVTEILHEFHSHIGLKNLVDRALVTISKYGDLDMHDLLQELGREIVRREYLGGPLKEPGQRSRLWSFQDIDKVLTQNTATDVVECLVLWCPKEYCLNIGAFARMKKLRALIFFGEVYWGHKQNTRGQLEFLSHELRLLKWHGYQLESLPNTFIPKNLVILIISHSAIQQLWEGTMPLQNLKEIRLIECPSLVKIPDLTEAIHLKKLDLCGCSSLCELHSSIFALQKLEYLDLQWCKQLSILPSSIHMKSLVTLKLSGCLNLEKFLEISDVMSELKDIYLDGTAIEELPKSINNLTGLAHLDLQGCKRLSILPSSIHMMKSLMTLKLSGCSILVKFPEISDVMSELKDLYLDRTAIEELPESINNLIGLAHLDLHGCEQLEILPSSIHMKSLKGLNLSQCLKLKKFLEISDVMSELEDLYLYETGIKELPESINNLTGLAHLDLHGCEQLEILPSSIHMKFLKALNLSRCLKVKKFPEISDVMSELEDLYLYETGIKELPESINNLTGLAHLDLHGCEQLEILPSSIHMKSLKALNLSRCLKLKKFLEISDVMSELEDIYLYETGIKELPESINNLTGLAHLDLHGCEQLEILPSSIHMKSLKALNLSRCLKLKKFPEISDVMSKLEDLYLYETAIRELPESINNLTGLAHLDLHGCEQLEILPSSIYMKSLKGLNLSQCLKLKKFPEISDVMSELEDLYLYETGIKELPESINNLTGLAHLDLHGCEQLDILPSSIHMKSLKALNLSRCLKVKKFPEISDVMSELEDLYLYETGIKELPESINNLTGLAHLDLHGCEQLEILPSSIHMKFLKALNLSRCLKVKKFPEISDVMSELEDLYLYETGIKELPESINNLTGLAHLDLHGCEQLEILPSSIHMKSLKALNLSRCLKVKKFPEISDVMSELEDLYLYETGIKELPESINNLTGLAHLDLHGCEQLEILPSSIHMKSLKALNLSRCLKLKKFPEISDVMSKLEDLYLYETAIRELPESINNLTGLAHLDLHGCEQLEILPSSIHMKSLKGLNLSQCLKLKKFPEISDVMSELEDLYLYETGIKELPESINNLTGLAHLDLHGCEQLEILPSSIHMKSLKALNLSRCLKVKKFPEISDVMSELEDLYLYETGIKELPESINNLTGLAHLDLHGCEQLEILPSSIHMKSLKALNLSRCLKVKKFPEISDVMSELEDLYLYETGIKELPESINNLTGLAHLDLHGCEQLEILPSSIHMKSLKALNLSRCLKLKKFLEISDVMSELEDIYLYETGIKELPESINNLTGLAHLDLHGCEQLEILPSSIHMKSLKALNLSRCLKLKKFPEISDVMSKLEDLYLYETAIRELPESINNLTGLAHLDLHGCEQLEILPSSIHMKSLKGLNLSQCLKLKKFPEISDVMSELEDLYLYETAIKELPESINNLTGLAHLDLHGCEQLELLPSNIHMKSLKALNLSRCLKLKKFPEISDVMLELEDLLSI